MKPQINKEQFEAMDLRVGKVVNAEKKEDADRLIRLTVDFGDEGTKNILTSLFPIYQPEDFINKKFIFIVNLEPRKFLGEESQGMILCASGEKPIPLTTLEESQEGSTIT